MMMMVRRRNQDWRRTKERREREREREREKHHPLLSIRFRTKNRTFFSPFLSFLRFEFFINFLENPSFIARTQNAIIQKKKNYRRDLLALFA